MVTEKLIYYSSCVDEIIALAQFARAFFIYNKILFLLVTHFVTNHAYICPKSFKTTNLVNWLTHKIDNLRSSFAAKETRSSVPSGMRLWGSAFANYFKTEGTISPSSAITISGVWRALSILSETIASLPLHVFEEFENGDKRKAKSHPLFFLLHRQPHELYTSYNFRESFIFNYALNGNAFALIQRNEDGEPIGLLLLASDDVTVYLDKMKNRLYYRVAGIQEIIQAVDMIHVAGMGSNGYLGLNKMAVHGKTLNGAKDLRDYAVNFFANGASPSGVLEYEGELSDDAFNRLKTSWQAQYGGVDNAGKTPLLEFGVKYQKIGATPQEAGLKDNRTYSLEDISRIFGVPMHLLSSLERATFNNIEHLTLQFVKLTIVQLCTRIEQEFERKLFTKKELGNYSINFNMEGLLRGDTKTRSAYYRTMFSIGALTINEIRQKENMNRVEGGDIHYRPLNMDDILKITDEDEDESQGEKGTSKTDKENENEGEGANK